MTDRIRITTREAGWLEVEVDDDPALTVVVRLDKASTGRISIAEMVLIRSPGVTADNLRSIRVGRIEAYANGPGQADVLAALDARAAMSAADRIAIDNGRGAGPPVGIRLIPGVPKPNKPVVLRSRVRNLRLQPPEGQPVPDSFYKEVARIFNDLAVESSRPAADLHEANPHIEKSRINSWIKEARRRGFLAAGERQSRRQS